MTKIKKHQCPSCGGDLTVDNDKQIYYCTSCGSTYDFDYFREEKLNEMGKTHLSRKEFAAAVDAYRLLLENNPHDFVALRGLMLAAAYLKDVEGLVSMGTAKHFAYDSKIVREVIGRASEEDKEYFTEFGRIYADKKLQIDCNRELENLRLEHRRIEAAIRLTDDTRYDYYIQGKHGSLTPPKPMFILMWCVTAYFFMWALGICAAFAGGDVVGMIIAMVVMGGLVLLAGCGINYGRIYPKIKAIKEIDTYIKEFQAELGYNEEQIRKYEEAAEKLLVEIRKNIHDFVKKDSLRMTDSLKEQAAEISKIKKHQCPSCGGSLRIDSDKQMYHCSFCGSSYDYEYFKEDRIHEMGETYLSRGEFMATADAYEFMLKKDPHDFLALRGLMLAAAHLTNMNELDQENGDGKFSFDPEMVSQAIESASAEDKDYFEEIAKVYSEKMKLIECKEKIEALWEEKRKINDVIAHNNLMRKDYYIGAAPPKNQFLIGWLVIAFWFLVVLICASVSSEAFISGPDYLGGSLTTLAVVFMMWLGMIGYNFLFVYPKVKKAKQIDKENSKLYVESGKMDEQIKDLENESAKLLAGLKKSIHDFVRKDRQRMKDKS